MKKALDIGIDAWASDAVIMSAALSPVARRRAGTSMRSKVKSYWQKIYPLGY